MEELIEKAKKLIEKIPYLTIASITPSGEPWISPVFAVHDEKYNFIFNSSVESQHSKNISTHEKVAIVIYDSDVKEGEGFGVYIEASVAEITEIVELESAIKIFCEKRRKTLNNTSEFLAPSMRRMYKVVLDKIWVNRYEKGRVPPDWKEEINLN